MDPCAPIPLEAPAFGIPGVVVLLLVAVPLWSPPLSTRNQVPDTVAVPPDPTCPECQLGLELQTVIGSETEEGHVDLSVTVARMENGYLVANRSSPYEIRAFDLAGVFMRKVGRFGGGPGEFRLIWNMVVAPGDTLHVIDRENLRTTLLSPDLEVVRTVRLPGIPYQRGYVPLQDGGWVVNALSPGANGDLRLLHRLNRSGEVLFSFGPSLGARTPHNSSTGAFEGAVAAGPGNRILTAMGSRFWINRWDEDGSLERAWELPRREWIGDVPAPGLFPGYDPRVEDLRIDADGMLWVLMRVADPDWEEGVLVEGRGLAQAHSVDITDHHKIWDSVIEVWDLTEARVLFSGRFPQYLTRFLGSEEVASLPEWVGDGYQLKIFRLIMK